MAEVTPNPVCLECNTEFLKTIERGAPRAYCLNCRPPKSLSKPLAKKVCPVCEEHFMGGGTRKYCSLECRNARINLDREARRTIAHPAAEKLCTRCDRTLPLTDFRKDKGRLDGLYPWCIECSREYKGHKKREPSKWSSKAEYDADRRAKMKDQRADDWFGNYLFTTYRITENQYAAMLEAQGGRCAICKTREPGQARGRSNGRFHIDHDHSCCPGRTSCGHCVRGLLCRACNIGVGLLKDNPDTLRSAVRYLATPPNRPMQRDDDGDQLALIS
jgi:hypothetical protein